MAPRYDKDTLSTSSARLFMFDNLVNSCDITNKICIMHNNQGMDCMIFKLCGGGGGGGGVRLQSN